MVEPKGRALCNEGGSGTSPVVNTRHFCGMNEMPKGQGIPKHSVQ